MNARASVTFATRKTAPELPLSLQRTCACGSRTHGAPRCISCRRRNGLIQRSAENEDPACAWGMDEIVRSTGQPMDRALRTDMEQSFGIDFSEVRLHTDAAAARSARHLKARAYTVGPNIVFAQGRFAPQTALGRHLIAHELTHVLQQRGASPNNVTLEPERAEHQARSTAAAVCSGHPVAAVQARPIGIDRSPDEVDPADATTFNRPELSWLDGSALNAVASRVLGVVTWPFGREFTRGFLSTLLSQPGERFDRIRTRFVELNSLTSHFDAKYQFARGYGIGLIEGLWNSLRGTFEGLLFLIQLPWKIQSYLIEMVPRLAQTYGPRLLELATGGDGIGRQLRAVLADMIHDPVTALRSVGQLFSGLFEAGLAQARALGRRAAGGALRFVEEPWPQLGRDVGTVSGMVLFEALLLVATDAIGNAVKGVSEIVGRLGARVVAETAGLLRRAGALATEAAGAIGRLATRVGGRLAELIEAFANWLRRLRQPLEESAHAAEIETAGARSSALSSGTGAPETIAGSPRPPGPGASPPGVPTGRGPIGGGAPRQNVLVVGAERPEEFSYASEVAGRGHQVTVVNPLANAEARAYTARGGNFVEGAIEDLPAGRGFDMIREDFPFPLGRAFQPTRAFVEARLSRLSPGGRWVLVTEDADFVTTLEAASSRPGIQSTVREFPAFHEAAPSSAYPRVSRRFLVIFEKLLQP
jgi:hypothetical protein